MSFPSRHQTAEVVLEAIDLQKHFTKKIGPVFSRRVSVIKAVDGVSFELRKGETLGIVGESGCGKSTLARLLMCLEQPTAGRALYHGDDLFTMSKNELRRARRNIQIVFQDPYASLNPRMTIGEIIAEPFAIHPDAVPKVGRSRRVKELLDVVGLSPDHMNRYPHQFSGGQRQRVGIARGLALNPEVIICDEPVSALDVSVQAQVMNLLADLQRDFELSYIFIAHDLSVVRHISDNVRVMYLGKFVETGSDTDIYEHAAHPYTQALLSSVPVPDPEFRGRSQRILLPGDPPSPADPPSGCRFRTRCWRAQDICAREEPALEPREGVSHPTACHYAGD